MRPDPAPPIAFGHRGALGHAPENTIAGFRLALAMGATGIESDAWLAADGVPVLVHDRTIRRRGRRIPVLRRTSAELGALGVPTLAGLYEACGTGYELSLDVEHPEVARPLLAVAREADALERLWLCHDDLGFLAALRTEERRVRLVHSVDLEADRVAFASHLDRMVADGVDALNMRWPAWSPERVEALHRRGLRAFAWDALEPATMDRLLDLGVDAIYSDFPDRIVGAIAAHQAGGDRA